MRMAVSASAGVILRAGETMAILLPFFRYGGWIIFFFISRKGRKVQTQKTQKNQNCWLLLQK
jgi:hypothetical protein